MSLRETQAFLTRCLRDDQFRQRLYGPDFPALADEWQLSLEDRAQLLAIDQADFERIARYARGQRIRRRNTEYALFLEHLGRFAVADEFLAEYHQAVTTGQHGRMEEIRRFDDFAFEYILGHRLPEYLVDVLRFCSVICEVAETPKTRPDGPVDRTPSGEIRASHVLSLRRPFTVAPFRYDVLRIADAADPYSTDPLPRPAELLIQRDWRLHKRARAYPLRDHPMLALLAQRPRSVLELGASLPSFGYDAVLRLARRRHADQILHAALPAELAGDGESGEVMPSAA